MQTTDATPTTPSATSEQGGFRVGDIPAIARLVHRALRYRWKLNPGEIKAMTELLPRNGVGLDVGAHKGAYAWWMARCVGPHGRVIAFEPQSRVAAPTARAFASLRHVKYLNCAVSDHSGQAPFSMWRGSTHGASLDGLEGKGKDKGGQPDAVEQVTVPMVSIDDIAERESLTRVDFIKIDVEGHEFKVLEGAKRVIERFRPALQLEAEFRLHGGPDSPDNPVTKLRNLLEPLGYRAYFFTREGKRDIADFSPAEHQTYGKGFYSNNFLFVHR